MKHADSPKQAKLLLRISDNVLDENDWPVAEFTFDERCQVIAIAQTKQGVYGIDSMPRLGDGVTALCRFLSYDATGCHHEQYHEVQIEDRWRSFVSPSELLTLIRSRLEPVSAPAAESSVPAST